MTPALRAVLLSPWRLRPYLGQIASHSYHGGLSAPTNKQIMTRSRHVCLTGLNALQLVFTNWISQESSIGASATITAAIEYPVGTFTQVLFSGAAQGAIADQSYVVSDSCAVSIPLGATFYVRNYYTNTAGITYNANGCNTSLGESCTFAASGVVDQTMGGTVANTSGRIGYGPAAIIGQTRNPSFLILGDSRAYGVNDAATGADSSVGEITRSIADAYAYSNMSSSGAAAYILAAAGSAAKTAMLGAYFSHVISNFGVNDLTSRTAAQTITNLQLIKALYPSKPFYQCTVAPKTTGAWTLADGSDQTVTAIEAQRVAMNTTLRNGAHGLTGYFEVADQVESSRDSGKWIAPGYTTDGLHETATANGVIKTSGAVNVAAMARLVRG
jgi:hypothetical protein